jgi:hypothetical protein
MKKFVLSTLLGASLMHCTQPKPEALQQEQAQERTALAQRQAEQLAQAQRTAQENLDRETRSAQNTQQQAAVDIQRLEALMTQACAGIENGRREQCPVGADSVAVVQDVASGVSLRMQSSAGTRDQFNHRVECYRAWGTVRNARSPANAAPLAPTACLIDVPGINMQLRDTGGTLDVELTTADNGRDDLRARAHLLDRHAAI